MINLTDFDIHNATCYTLVSAPRIRPKRSMLYLYKYTLFFLDLFLFPENFPFFAGIGRGEIDR